MVSSGSGRSIGRTDCRRVGGAGSGTTTSLMYKLTVVDAFLKRFVYPSNEKIHVGGFAISLRTLGFDGIGKNETKAAVMIDHQKMGILYLEGGAPL